MKATIITSCGNVRHKSVLYFPCCLPGFQVCKPIIVREKKLQQLGENIIITSLVWYQNVTGDSLKYCRAFHNTLSIYSCRGVTLTGFSQMTQTGNCDIPWHTHPLHKSVQALFLIGYKDTRACVSCSPGWPTHSNTPSK